MIPSSVLFIVDVSKREEFLKVSEDKVPINKLLARAEKLREKKVIK